MNKKDLDKYIFRKTFFKKKDEVILANVSNFFCAVRNVWPEYWSTSNTKSVLYKTVGVKSLFRFFSDIYKYINSDHVENYDLIVTIEQYETLLLALNIPSEEFEQIEAISKSVGYLYNMLKDKLVKFMRDQDQ